MGCDSSAEKIVVQRRSTEKEQTHAARAQNEQQQQQESTNAESCDPSSAELTQSFDGINEESLKFFKENGFLVFKQGTIPLEMLKAATPDMEAGVSHQSSCSQKLFDLLYKTELHRFVTQLLGSDPAPDFRGWVQVATQAPGGPPVGPHIDLGHHDKPPATADTLDRFCMLLGIPFTAFPEENMGNFGVYRGSHLRVAEAIEQHGGYDAMFSRPEKFADPSHPEYEGAKHKHAFWVTHQPSSQGGWMDEPGEKVPLKVVLGQAYLAHFNTIHYTQDNLAEKPRNVIYFRIQHPRAHTDYDKDAFVNLWKDYPPFGGEWPQ